MKIVFLLICVFLALAGVAGLPAPYKLAEDQILKKNDQKNTRGMRYLRYEDETNARLTKRSPVAPLVELTSELLAKKDNENQEEGEEPKRDGRLTKRSPVSPTLTRRKRDDFDLAEAEADPRKKRFPEGDARKKLAAEAEADPRKKRSPEGDARKKLAAEANHRRNKRSPFEVASESDTVSRVSVRETEAYP